jgi:hypothetical protein
MTNQTRRTTARITDLYVPQPIKLRVADADDLVSTSQNRRDMPTTRDAGAVLFATI